MVRKDVPVNQGELRADRKRCSWTKSRRAAVRS